MIDKDLQLYLATWFWQAIALMFMLFGITMMQIGEFSWALGLFGVFIVCEYFSWKRRYELEKPFIKNKKGGVFAYFFWIIIGIIIGVVLCNVFGK